MRLFNILAIIGSAFALECEVCNTFLGKAQKILTEEKITDAEKIENRLRKMCKDAKEQDNRFCYYTGLAADAATTMHKVTFGLPVLILIRIYFRILSIHSVSTSQ